MYRIVANRKRKLVFYAYCDCGHQKGIVIPRIVGWVFVDPRIRIKSRRGILVWKQINVRQRITHHISLKKQLSLDNFIFTLIINGHRERWLASSQHVKRLHSTGILCSYWSRLPTRSRLTLIGCNNLRTCFINFQDEWRPPQRTNTIKWTFMFYKLNKIYTLILNYQMAQQIKLIQKKETLQIIRSASLIW